MSNTSAKVTGFAKSATNHIIKYAALVLLAGLAVKGVMSLINAQPEVQIGLAIVLVALLAGKVAEK